MSVNEIWLLESPVQMIEGEVIAYSIDWLGASKVENPTATVYKRDADITSSAMISGDSHLVSNNVVTLKKITAGASDGGSRYVVVVQATVDSKVEKRKLLIQVVKAGSE